MFYYSFGFLVCIKKYYLVAAFHWVKIFSPLHIKVGAWWAAVSMCIPSRIYSFVDLRFCFIFFGFHVQITYPYIFITINAKDIAAAGYARLVKQ